ncbi:MAG TPA: hypothetical protein VN851_05480 [Thermoanaerobaculia bacterium]|nr:hypothetical protein [Thermoanaerobaculia bacterium]
MARKSKRHRFPLAPSAPAPSTLAPSALEERRPPRDRRAQLEQLLAVFASNAFIGFLLVSGRIDPLGLVLLVAFEALLLSVVEAVESRFVPPEARADNLKQFLPARLALLLFIFAVILGCNLALISAVLKMGDAVLALLRDPSAALRESQILWPLGVTLLGGVVGAVRDLRRFRERGGGKLVSTPGWNAGARWLIVILSVIPHAVPLLGLLALGGRYLAKRSDRAARGLATPIAWWQIAMFFVVWSATFFAAARFYTSGLAGWSTAFCVAKFLSDAYFAGTLGTGKESDP